MSIQTLFSRNGGRCLVVVRIFTKSKRIGLSVRDNS